MNALISLAVLATGAVASSSCCPVIFDGRVPSNATLKDFDTANGGSWNPFNPGFVKGNDLLWSDILKFPDVAETSLFDASTNRALEVTLSDQSIFQKQLGFRRAGLLFNKDSNEGSPAVKGVVTVHFSLQTDQARALNLSHEYLLVWHERADFAGNQFNFQTGTLIGRETEAEPDTFKLLDLKNTLLWETKILDGQWQNFAVTLDFDNNTIAAFYSAGNEPLQPVLEPTPNDNSGEGQYQIGMLKKPTGTDDVVNSGFQESNLDEGLIYGGVFIENSSGGCISTQGQKKLRHRARRVV